MVCSWCHLSTLDRLVSFGKKAPTEQTARNFSPYAGKFSPFSGPTAVAAERSGDIRGISGVRATRFEASALLSSDKTRGVSDQPALVVHARSRSSDTRSALGAHSPDDHGLPI